MDVAGGAVGTTAAAIATATTEAAVAVAITIAAVLSTTRAADSSLSLGDLPLSLALGGSYSTPALPRNRNRSDEEAVILPCEARGAETSIKQFERLEVRMEVVEEALALHGVVAAEILESLLHYFYIKLPTTHRQLYQLAERPSRWLYPFQHR